MFDIGLQELVVIFVIALIVFGPKNLPQLGRALGRAMREFRRASDEFRSTIETNLQINETDPLPASPLHSTPGEPAPAGGTGEGGAPPDSALDSHVGSVDTDTPGRSRQSRRAQAENERDDIAPAGDPGVRADLFRAPRGASGGPGDRRAVRLHRPRRLRPPESSRTQGDAGATGHHQAGFAHSGSPGAAIGPSPGTRRDPGARS